jgi:hypothetical protein
MDGSKTQQLQMETTQHQLWPPFVEMERTLLLENAMMEIQSELQSAKQTAQMLLLDGSVEEEMPPRQ